jgi:putative membrane protein
MHETAYYLDYVPAYLAYMGVAVGMLIAAVGIYVVITPYREIALIRAGNATAACSLGGTVVGLAITLSSAVRYAVSIPDVVLWGATALVFQLLGFLLVRMVLPDLRQRIEQNMLSHGLLLGLTSIAIGILNAACLTPPPV